MTQENNQITEGGYQKAEKSAGNFNNQNIGGTSSFDNLSPISMGDTDVDKKSKSPSKLILALGIIVLIIAAIAGLVFVKGEEFGILRPKPEKILAQMMQNMAGVRTMHTEGEGVIIITSKEKNQSANINFKIISEEDSSDEENPKVKLNYDIDVAFEGMSFSANADIALIDKAVYIKLNKAPLLGVVDLGEMKGKWLKIDLNELQKSSYPFGDSKNVGSFEESSAKTKEIIEKYQGDLIKIKAELPDEKINGAAAYHYVLVLNKDILSRFINEIKTINEEAVEDSGSDIMAADESLKEMQDKLIDEMVELVSEKADIQIFVGKKNKMPYGASIKFNMQGKDMRKLVADISPIPPVFSNDLDGMVLDASINLKYSNFNMPVVINAPEDAEDFMKTLGIEKSLETAKKKAHDSQRLSDLQQLRAPLILYHDDKGTYPITNGMEKTNDKNSAIYKLAPNYIFKIPIDPLDSDYYYGYKSDGKSYELTARAEYTYTNCTRISQDVCLIVINDKGEDKNKDK